MRLILMLGLLALVSSRSSALPPDAAQKLYERIASSLVVVQYTVEGEFGRRELIGQGVIVGEEGLVMTSLAIFAPSIPDEQMKEFKIILPGDDEKEFDAVFLGRDERSDTAFLKTRQPQKWQAIQFEDVPLKVAEPIVSVGLLPKEAGYKAFYLEAAVAANLRGPTPMVLVSPGGLTTVGSPVFNSEGKAVGLVAYQQGQTPLLNRGQGGSGLMALALPARMFVPSRDFLLSVKNPPKGQPIHLPWLGAQLTGISKEVAEYYGLKGTPVAQVGEVIPDSPAARAGFKPGDKIVKVNGRALDRGDEPDETPQILLRQIRRMNVGDKIKFAVQREKAAPPVELAVELDLQPKQANTAKRYYAEDLGLSVREIVFSDTYAKKVAADTKGVVVAFVRQASSANSAGLRSGDMVTQLNKEAVTGLDDFTKRYKEFREKNPKELVVLMVLRDQKTEVIKIEPPQ